MRHHRRLCLAACGTLIAVGVALSIALTAMCVHDYVMHADWLRGLFRLVPELTLTLLPAASLPSVIRPILGAPSCK